MSRHKRCKTNSSVWLCDLTHHVCQCDVKEHSSCDGKDWIGGKIAPENDAEHETDVTRHSRQQVEENSLRYAHTGVQQDHKVTCRGKETQGGYNRGAKMSFTVVSVVILSSVIVSLV